MYKHKKLLLSWFQAFLEEAKGLLLRGIPLDGIGVQGHFTGHVNPTLLQVSVLPGDKFVIQRQQNPCLSLKKTQDIENTWERVDKEFLFESLTRKLTSERSEPVRCRVEHEERNSISTSNHVLFCLSYKHNSPLMGRQADFINE